MRQLKRAKHFFNTSKAFATNAVQRRLNKHKFIQADKSLYDIIYYDDLMSVRHYKAPREDVITIDDVSWKVRKRRYAVPIVLVPPLGVFAWIFDLMADRSMVRFFLAHGFDVYLIDWGAPKGKDNNISLETYIHQWFPGALAAIRKHAGTDDLSLVGYCMGGLLAALYLATYEDKRVLNLVTIASPIDMHQMGFIGPIYKALEKPIWGIGKVTGLKITNMQREFFHVPGNRLSVMFKLTNPLGVASSYFQLLRHLGDDEYVSRYMTMNEWFSNMPDYPGATIQELIRKMGLYNRMKKGRIRIGNQVANFSNISANLLAFAGDNDKIVSVKAAEAIMDVVGSQEKSFHIVPGGHAGVFTGSKAAHTTWLISKNWLASRSQPYVWVDETREPGEVIGASAV